MWKLWMEKLHLFSSRWAPGSSTVFGAWQTFNNYLLKNWINKTAGKITLLGKLGGSKRMREVPECWKWAISVKIFKKWEKVDFKSRKVMNLVEIPNKTWLIISDKNSLSSLGTNSQKTPQDRHIFPFHKISILDYTRQIREMMTLDFRMVFCLK